MGYHDEKIFGAMFFLFGLCVVVLLGRVPGFLVGSVFAGIAFLTLGRGMVRVAMLALVCVVGLVITVYAGATPEFIINDLTALRTADGRMEMFALPGARAELRLGFGLVGSGICGLVLALFSGSGEDGPL